MVRAEQTDGRQPMTWSSVDWTATEAVVGRIQDRIFRAAKIKRPRLEPDDEQSSCPVLRGLGSGNGARLPDYGRTGVSAGYDGARARARRKPRAEWLAFQPGAHEGYVEWDRAEAIRTMVSENVPAGARGAPKLGAALLSGLLRCRRCGRKLSVQHTGAKAQIPRYACVRGRLDYGEPSCIAFGGLRVADVVGAALLSVVQPAAVEAARAAEEQAAVRGDEAREAMARDLE